MRTLKEIDGSKEASSNRKRGTIAQTRFRVHVLNTKMLIYMAVRGRVKNTMSYCPKCGAKTREEMSFCPKCGTNLKAEKTAAPAPATAPPTPPPHVKVEKEEKREKEEKGEKNEPEKGERYVRRESAFMGPLIGGFVLIFAGLAFYAMLTGLFSWQTAGALFFVLIGIIIIVGAVYAATMAARRHPRT